MNLSVESTYPLWLLLPLTAVVIWIVWLLYFRKKQESPLPRIVRILLGILRASVILLAGLLFISPWVRSTIKNKVKPLFIVARDNSVSMSPGSDSALLTETRDEHLDRVRNKLDGVYGVKEYLFGSQIRPGSEWDYSDDYTCPDQLFEEVHQLSRIHEIGGMLIITDGVATRGQGYLEAAGRVRFPVSFLATGDTTRYPDVSILEVNSPEWVRKESRFQVRVYVGLHNWPGDQVKVSLTNQGGLVATQVIDLKKTQEPFIDFDIQAPDHGILTLKAEVQSSQLEKDTGNNAQAFTVNVIGEEAHILALYESPHPDIAALQRALGGLQQVVWEARQAGQNDSLAHSCHLLILHGLPSRSNPMASLLGQAQERRIPLLLIMSSSTDPGQITELNASITCGDPRKEPEPVQASLSPGFMLFTLPDGFREHLRAWPPLMSTFQTCRFPADAVTLFAQRIGAVELPEPLMLFIRNDEVRVGILTAEGIWKWRIHDFLEFGDHQVFDETVSRVIQYLLQDDQADRFVVKFPPEINGFSDFRVTARLLNESLESVNQPDVILKIRDSSGQTYEYLMGRTADGYEMSVPGLPAGDYAFESGTQLGAERFLKDGWLTVSSRYQEQKDPVALHQDLKLVSYLTGGICVTAEGMDSLVDELNLLNPERQQVRSEYRWYDLINFYWLLGIIILLLAMEWFFRRWYGTR